MTLHEYLSRHALRPAEFARSLGVSAATISRVLNGRVVPRRALMAAIHAATGGRVTPNDLLDLHPAEETRDDR